MAGLLRSLRTLLPLLPAVLAACSGGASPEPASSDQDIVGGTAESRWGASGYLVHGHSMAALDTSRVACGATLIAPNVVVTAAHCVLADAAGTWAFGTGKVGGGALVKVASRTVHPEFHPRQDGVVDIPAFLRKNDVAYLVLEHAVAGVEPASLLDAPPKDACNVQAIGYHAVAGKGSQRRSTPACVLFKVQLGDDPIFEVHPAGASGLCNTDGDEGSPVVLRDASRTVLVGFYVGSVTQSLTDCKSSVQFLDGYESAYGYRTFFQQGIDAGAAALGTTSP
jgi:hypothetical protein